MRHLFVTQDFLPDRGGMARRHFELARHWPEHEMAVSTVAHPRGDVIDENEDIHVDRQPFDFAHAKVITSQLRWARWLVADRGDYDVLHCGNVRPVGYAVWWAARRTGAPYLLYVNGGDILREREKTRGWLKRVAAKRIFGDAAGIVANSAWTARVTRDVVHGTRFSSP